MSMDRPIGCIYVLHGVHCCRYNLHTKAAATLLLLVLDGGTLEATCAPGSDEAHLLPWGRVSPDS